MTKSLINYLNKKDIGQDDLSIDTKTVVYSIPFELLENVFLFLKFSISRIASNLSPICESILLEIWGEGGAMICGIIQPCTHRLAVANLGQAGASSLFLPRRRRSSVRCPAPEGGVPDLLAPGGLPSSPVSSTTARPANS